MKLRERLKKRNELVNEQEVLQEIFKIHEIDDGIPLLVVKTSYIFSQKYKEYKQKDLECLILKDALAEDMRINPSKWGLKDGKDLSENMITRVVVRDPDYVEAYKELIESKSEVKKWEGYITALNMKNDHLNRK